MESIFVKGYYDFQKTTMQIKIVNKKLTFKLKVKNCITKYSKRWK